MKNPYDSYLMRKSKPKFLGFYCGKPVYEGDNVNLKQLKQMSLRVASRVNLVDDGMKPEIDTTQADSELHKAECAKAGLDLELQGKITFFLVCVFIVLLVTL